MKGILSFIHRSPYELSRKILFAENLLLILACLAAVYLIGHLLAFEYGRDQGIYAVMAEGILHGKAPYKDIWDFKPPGIFFFFALSRILFGASVHAVRILEALVLASLFWAFLILSRRFAGGFRPGIIGGLIGLFGYISFDFWDTAQPESISAGALAWAVVCATYIPVSDMRRQKQWLQFVAWACAGALYAAAALLKPPLGGGFVISLAIVVISQWRGQHQKPWLHRIGPPILSFAIGGILPILAVLAYFARKQALGDLFEIQFIFVPEYTALAFDAAQLPVLMCKAIYQWFLFFSPYNVLGLAFLLLLPPLHKRERGAVLHVLGVIIPTLIGVAFQAKFFGYHYGAAVPLTGLLAGWGFWKVWIRVRHTVLGWLGMGLVIYLLGVGWIPGLPNTEDFWIRCRARISMLMNPERREAIKDEIYSFGGVDAGANRRTAQWIAEHTPPDCSIYIWGFEPIIYDQSHRRPATRYIYNVPQRVVWGNTKARKVLLEDLKREDPAAIVIAQRDRMRHVTGSRKDSRAALASFPELSSWIRARYKHAKTIKNLEILIRKDKSN